MNKEMKKQFLSIRNNWMLILVVVLLFLLLNGAFGVFNNNISLGKGYPEYSTGTDVARMDSGIGNYYYGGGDFVPDETDRKITKNSFLGIEVGGGDFDMTSEKVKAVIISSDSFLLSEDLSKNDEGIRSYTIGSYQIKVEADKYDFVISQLKNLGEIQSMVENSLDVTGSYTNLKIELEVEKEKLMLYRQIYDSAKDVGDKISLTEQIFNQERRVKYLEDSLNNVDQRIEYSTIYLTISEERSEYFDVYFIGFSDLVKKLISSLNDLLSLIFFVIPWLIAAWLIRFFWKKRKRKRR